MYTAVDAAEWSIGQGPNGTGRRKLIKGAYTISPDGRRCRAFTDREGGLVAAQKWANELNLRHGLRDMDCEPNTSQCPQ